MNNSIDTRRSSKKKLEYLNSHRSKSFKYYPSNKSSLPSEDFEELERKSVKSNKKSKEKVTYACILIFK
jgi:hypothetical protein